MSNKKQVVSISINSTVNETALLRKAVINYGCRQNFESKFFLILLEKIKFFLRQLLINLLDKKRNTQNHN